MTHTTGHAVNTAGVACPTKEFRGRTLFVVPQHYAVCGKADQRLLPPNYLEAPKNAAVKSKILAKRATDKAVKAAQTAEKMTMQASRESKHS